MRQETFAQILVLIGRNFSPAASVLLSMGRHPLRELETECLCGFLLAEAVEGA